jgi:hypothetical protein
MASRTMVSAFVRRGGQAHATVGDGNEGRWPVGEGIEELESRNVAAPLPLPAAQPTPVVAAHRAVARCRCPAARRATQLACIGGRRERTSGGIVAEERKKEWGKKKGKKKRKKKEKKEKENINELFVFINCDL